MSAPTRIAVVGGGTMGAGIAALACRHGIATVLCDVDEAAVDAGVRRVTDELARRVRRGRMTTAEADATAALLTGSADLAAVAGTGLVLEAVPEEPQLKRDLFARVARIAPAAVLASNTSSIPIATIADAVAAPERVLGLHFFNPPGAMRLVELVTTPATAADAAATARALAVAIGKQVVAVADGPGFLVNRCARPYYLEALRIVETGVATAPQVDRACEAAGFPMGPFRLMDTIGIDVSLAVTRSMFEQSGGEPRWQPTLTQEVMAASGKLGRKSGSGFYDYGDDAAPDVGEHAAASAGDAPALVERIVAQLVNEAWFALDAGVARTQDDVDLAMTVGLGHPRGPFAWGRELGLQRVVALLGRLAGRDGDARYRVAAGLMAAAG
ncbi:3-hydroxyacyl-CoA dehydrogenase [Conexibacter woesei]|uniref:Enoyl-CoA hydratase n=1 Tax=Conexibacter woesei (strain DSM 14684 / CCUG 47730 / CIP 108061 / JCM 11494 / NBRC 100937 / ID131577) TaxID=469383 RepID=D3F5B3_CONWI|nr:3-hydroxyacyl-CoA dehydrogenase NAD-binding domain-containing protein [Conexibacter woesei]ADB50580.1 Enoyl-CoA hydratase [Conexibacter woesei DSM 14684]